MARDGSSDGEDKKVGWQTPWDKSYVVALDAKTGEEDWKVEVEDASYFGCNITGAPIVVKDMNDGRAETDYHVRIEGDLCPFCRQEYRELSIRMLMALLATDPMNQGLQNSVITELAKLGQPAKAVPIVDELLGSGVARESDGAIDAVTDQEILAAVDALPEKARAAMQVRALPSSSDRTATNMVFASGAM